MWTNAQQWKRCAVCYLSDESADRQVVFAHQSRWQQKMLMRYGRDVCLIDATHNTTVYGLPLFLLCVPTNCGYVTVASLLLCDEQADTIRQGLQKVAEWCPGWTPRCVLSDYCEAQITAVENVFRGILTNRSSIVVIVTLNQRISSLSITCRTCHVQKKSYWNGFRSISAAVVCRHHCRLWFTFTTAGEAK